jgi:hypothetical protein
MQCKFRNVILRILISIDIMRAMAEDLMRKMPSTPSMIKLTGFPTHIPLQRKQPRYEPQQPIPDPAQNEILSRGQDITWYMIS